MLDDDKLEKVLELYFNRFNNINTEVLKLLGETIKQFDGVTPSQAHKIAQKLKYGTDLDELINEISKASGKSAKEVRTLLDKVAEENVDFAEVYYKAKNKEFISYKDNKQLRRYVSTVSNQTNELFKNIADSRNIGFTFIDKKGNTIFKPLRDVYNDLIDEAVYNVSTGVTDYQSAMRSTIRKLADSGIKVHEEKVGYKSGYNRRIDTAVRQNILDGIRTTNIGIQNLVGEEFGADGVEISAHSPCAEDHLEYQGHQYSTNKYDEQGNLIEEGEYEKIEKKLVRQFGTLNCRHFVFRIVLGVNQPSYTNKELKEMEKESHQKVKYKGKTYTKYQATQEQRRIETEVRKQKDRQIIARASEEIGEVDKAQQKISQLTTLYKDFSESVGLPTYIEKMQVSGYHRVKAKK